MSFIPRRPPRLGPGSTLGIVSPSSPIPADRLERGIESLERAGFRVRMAEHARDARGYLAGDDRSRAADFTSFFARPDVDAIICSRGGYGAARMVDLVDWDVVRAHPKAFIGYSDITTLHLALERRVGLVSFHGPMVTTFADDVTDECLESLVGALTKAEAPGVVGSITRPARTIVRGMAVGRLAGGCLTLLCAAMGTPYEPDLTDRIVIIEDTDEPLYRVDRFVMQLKASGALDRAAGFVIGTSSRWDAYPEANAGLTLDDIWHELLAPLGKPTIADFPIGHVDNPLTLPLGCMAELDADRATLTVTEPAVE